MTVYKLPACCWVITPKLPLDAQDPHYDTRTGALAAIREAWDEDRDWSDPGRIGAWWREVRFLVYRLRRDAPKPRQLKAVCWLIQCDGCEEPIDEQDEGYIAHCTSRLDAEETMAAYEWSYRGDLAFCPADAPGDSVPVPPSPAEQEAAGQLRFPGVAS